MTFRHRSKDVVLYRRGDIDVIVNHESRNFAQAFATVHGPSICAFTIRVRNAAFAYDRIVKRGAIPSHGAQHPCRIGY